jgi:UDP-N-acetylglucosamine acyltransferase
MARLHPSAVVDRRAELAGDVEVGPFAVVEAGVRLAEGCVLHSHAVVRGITHLGARNVVHPFAVVGGEPQAKRHGGGPARLECGEDNVFREHVTVHGGTEGRVTRVGRGNLFMVGSHVGHDVTIGQQCVLANGVLLAGHAVVEDGVTFGGLSAAAQFVRIGEAAFVAGVTGCERDVPPFVIVQGNRARVRGANVVGLRRRGVPEESVRALQRAVRRIWLSASLRAEALRSLEGDGDPYVRRLLDAIRGR